jgi:zinc transport system substrate-binding protein
MRKSSILIIVALVLSLVAALILGGCAPTDTSKLKVVTSTSLIAFLVEEIGNGKIDVVNIVPPAQCPGHFDVKPGDIQKLANADLFIMHGWQGEKFSQSLIDSANNPKLVVSKLDVEGNWMTPPVQIEAVDKINAALCQVDDKNCSSYQETTLKYKSAVEAKGAELKAKLAQSSLDKINVLCDEQQAGFVKWVGLNIVGTFGRPETLTPQIVKELIDKARAENVTLLIENLQSGHDAGKGIAEELGCKRTTLSNFPGGLPDTDTWEKAIDRNVELILEAIAK